MQNEHAQRIVQIVLEWAKAQPTICAVALVGSHARGTARADSDIDLIVLTTDPQCFRADTAWLRAIDWNVIAARPAEWQDEDYGVLWSRRMWLEPNRDEVEIGFALPSLRASGPSCSVATLPLRATLTRWLSKIWPSLASAQSRAATLHTVPIAV